MRGESSSDRAEALRSSERAAERSSSESASSESTPFSSAELGLDAEQRIVRFLHAERWTGFSIALHCVALFCMALMPPKSSALALDMLNEETRYARYLAAPVELDPPTFLDSGEPPQAEGARAADSEGAAGKPDAPRAPARRGGGPRRDQPTDARAQAQRAGILGVLHQVGGSINIGPNPFDPAGIDPNVANALGALTGSGVGENFGFNGLGMRDTGRGGGGDAAGSVGVGKLGSGLGGSGYCGDKGPCNGMFRGRDHVAKVPQAIAGVADVRGSLSKEVIRRVIQRHLNEVRYCYTEGLRSAPELTGRVQVMFVIASAGTVLEASVASSDLHQSGVENCIASAVRRWTFPAPDGGGYVTVRYPFVFEQIGQ